MIIGKNIESGENVRIDLKKLLDTRAIITASSGGGKSWMIRKLLQESYGKVQQIILDWEGEYSNLRPEFDYLIIGDNGEIPISIKTAEILAKKVMELSVSTILDLSDLPRHDRILFVKRFLDSLLNLPKELYDHLVLLVIDEAHQLCPQKGNAESMNSVIDAMSLGRKRGIGTALCTQRIAKLNKDAVAEARNVIMGGMGLLEDRKRACDEMGFNTKSLEQSIKNLEPGEMYMCGSAISKEVIKVKVGDIKIKPPKIGQKGLVSVSKTPEAIKKILKGLTDLPKEAEQELKTKQDMQKKISELKRDLRVLEHSKPKPEIDEKSIERAKQQAFREAEISFKQQFQNIEKEYLNKTKQLENNYRLIEKKLIDIGKILDKEIPKLSIEPIKSPNPIKFQSQIKLKEEYSFPKKTIVKEPESIVSNSYDEEEIKLSPAYKRMLKNSAMFYPEGITKAKLSILSDVPQKASTFRNGLSSLKTKGLIILSGGFIICTERGLEIAGEVEQIPTDTEGLVEMWCNKLSPAYERMFRCVVSKFPTEIPKEDLSFESGIPIDASTFRNGLSKLKTLGLIKIESGQISASPELFE